MPHRNRTRVHSNNSADFAKDEETLQGLRFTSPRLMTPPRNVREDQYTPPISNRSTTFDLDLRIPARSYVKSHSAQKDLTTKNRAITRHVRNPSAPDYNNKNAMHMPLTVTSNPEEFQLREFRDEFEKDTNLFRQMFDSKDVDNHHDPVMDVQDFSVEIYHECLNDIAEIKRTGSGGGVSVISCLTNDDTHTPASFDEPQDKDDHGHEYGQSSSNGSGAHAIAVAPTVPSQGLRLPAVPVMTRPTRPKPLHTRAATVGKDFGSVFDHLVREDKLDKYLNGHETKRKQHHQQTQQQGKDKRGPGSVQTSRPNRRPANLARPPNLAHHSRCQSDTMAYRPKTSSSYSHPNKGHFRSPSNLGSTSAHATLREQLTCTMDDSPSLSLLVLKPQITMSRSTSNTAQSSSGGTASSGMSELEVKAIGQVAGPPNVNDSVSATHSNGSRHYRRHSSGFGTNDATVFSLPKESVPENSAVSMPRTKAEEEHGSFSQILVLNQHGGFLNGRIRFDDKDSRGGEEEASSRLEDKSVASSDSRFTSGRNILKEEFKFMIGRIVPWPIKKVAQMARRKPKLSRSEGCLT